MALIEEAMAIVETWSWTARAILKDDKGVLVRLGVCTVCELAKGGNHPAGIFYRIATLHDDPNRELGVNLRRLSDARGRRNSIGDADLNIADAIISPGARGTKGPVGNGGGGPL